MTPMLSQSIIDRTQDFLRRSYDVGEWHGRAAICNFLHDDLGYAEDTAHQYMLRYLKWAVANREIERSPSGRSWRWVAPPPPRQPAA